MNLPGGSGLEKALAAARADRALEIRTMMRSKVRTTDGKEIFVFNGEGGSWSTVCRTSTASNPVLTASPFDACEKVLSVMRACKAVSKVTISDESGVEISLEQVRTMQFVPIEESAALNAASKLPKRFCKT